ncbi:MAG: hypothetical protein ACT4PV_02705 [Planctomycetaceae bacterium]
MQRSITAATLLLILAACSAWKGQVDPLGRGRRPVLPYACYQSLQTGMNAREILGKFGPPEDLAEKDGAIRFLLYPCEDANGESATLRMAFSHNEALETSRLLRRGSKEAS